MARAAVACAVALGVGVPAVRAEPSDAALIWRAPVGCPSAGDVRARIERRLGSVPRGIERSETGGGDPDGSAGGAGGSAPRGIDGMVRGVAVDVADRGEGAAPRFVARIDLRGLRGADAAADDEVRVLSSARCDELADAVAVVVARLAAELRSPPPAPPGAPPRAGSPPAELRLARPGSEHALPAPWGADLRVLGVSGIGAQPGVSLGGELAGTLRVRSAIVELAGMQWLSSSRALRADAPGRIDVDLRLAALRLGWGSARLPLRAWLSGELGMLRGGEAGSFDPRAGTARWLAVGSGFAVAWPMGPRARLIGTIEAVVPIQRARIVLQDGSEIYRSSLAAVRSGLGLEVGWL